MIKLSIPIPELKAAALFASRDHTRFALVSVCLVLRPAGHPVNLIATDGRRICAIKSSAVVQEGALPEVNTNILIPLPLIKLATPYNKKEKLVMLTIEPIVASGIQAVNATPRYKLTFDDGDQSVSRRSTDGNYPVLKGIFPTEKFSYCATPICVNPQFMADLAQVAVLLKPGKYAQGAGFASSKQGGPIHVKMIGIRNFACIIMPLRPGEGGNVNAAMQSEDFDTPTWVDQPAEPATVTGKAIATP